ncbi:MAG: sugar phosphate isomerase/epimerase [Lentisphaerae bacterium]|nr:sugar phosphate isomerase/epimerase [Lentisphaerota bacterium]
MKIGCPTDPRKDPAQTIAWAAEHGFDFIDLYLEPELGALERIDTGDIRRALDDGGMDVLGHLAWYLPIGSAMPQLRQAAVQIAIDYLQAFAEIRVPAVTVHSDWPTRLFTEDDGLRWQKESIEQIISAASTLGVRIMYEPVPTYHDTAENAATLLESLPDLLLHLDIGHSNLCGRKPGAVIRKLGNRLFHVHLNDNNGEGDLHLPPGTGNIDWPDVFQALHDVGYDNTITVEVFSPDKDYLLLAKDKVASWSIQDRSDPKRADD